MSAYFANTFVNGMNRDASANQYPKDSYYGAANFRPITTEGLTNGALETVRGNAELLTLPNSGVVLGGTVIRDYLILFVKDSVSDKIYRIPKTAILSGAPFTVSDAYYFKDANGHLVYSSTELNFDTSYPIRVVANYENDDVQKLYFVDGLNPLRHLNIVYDIDTNDLENLDASLLNILSYNTFGVISTELQDGGNLKTGKVQYAYQLYAVHGGETVFSPASPLVTISKYSDFEIADRSTGGSPSGEFANKSIKITLQPHGNDTFDIFDRVRVVALDYEDYGKDPSVRIVAEKEISGNTVTVTDYGNSLGEISIEDFRYIQSILIPQDLAVYKNRLYAANIKYDAFDVDNLGAGYIDTRSYRYRITTTPNYTDETSVGFGSTSLVTSLSIIYTYRWTVELTWDVKAAAEAAHGVGTFVRYDDTSLFSISQNPSGYDYLGLIISTATYGDKEIRLRLDNIISQSYDDVNGKITISGEYYVPGYEPPYDSFTYPPGNVTTVRTTDTLYAYYTYNPGVTSAETECRINYGTTNERIIDDSDPGTYSAVPHTDDCINVFNDITNDSDTDKSFKYKHTVSNTSSPTFSDLGGTGLHVDFEFVESPEITIGEETVDSAHTYNRLSVNALGYADSATIYDYTGYQRDETYRFGIIFYDLYGRPSYPKWIADIRFPNLSDSPAFTNDYKAKALGIKFTLKWLSRPLNDIIDKISGFQIVRAERREADRTVKSQGIAIPLKDISSTTSPNLVSLPSFGGVKELYDGTVPAITYLQDSRTASRQYFEVITPELVTGQNNLSVSSDKLELFGNGENVTAYTTTGASTDTVSFTLNVPKTVVGTTFSSGSVLDPSNITNIRKSIVDFNYSYPKDRDSSYITVNTKTYFPRTVLYDGSGISVSKQGFRGRGVVLSVDTAYDINYIPFESTNYHEVAVVNVRAELGTSQYGGATYEQRLNTEYIPASDFIWIDHGYFTQTAEVYGGDTYLCMFYYLHSMLDIAQGGNGSMQSFIAVPVETKINLAMRDDPMLKYMQWTFPHSLDDPQTWGLLEEEAKGIIDFPELYPTNLGDLYKYNTVFSQEDFSRKFYPKPFDFNSSEEQDYRVTVSKLKYPGEYTDSWLKFKPNDYLDLDSKYGSIVRIENFRDKLFTFQSDGVAYVASLEREQQPSSNLGTLVLGTGGVLARYDYVDVGYGTNLYNSIINTNTSLVYFDSTRKQIRMLDKDGFVPISEIKGMKSYFDSIGTITDMNVGYDIENREILFTPITSGGTEKTLVFNGFTGLFTGFYDIPEGAKYLAIDEILLESIDDNKWFVHGTGNYGEFFGNSYDHSVDIIVNPSGSIPVTLMFLKWLTYVTSTGSSFDITNETFSTLQVKNSYQDTGLIALSPGTNAKRKYRMWRVNALRDSVSNNGRLRDSYFHVTLSYSNTNYRKLVLYNLFSNIVPTKLR